MTTRTKFILFLALLGVMLMLLACYSTACMSDEQIGEWVRGATPVPCWQ